MIESRPLKRSFFTVLLFGLGFPFLLSLLYLETHYKKTLLDSFIQDRQRALDILGKAIAPNVWFYDKDKARIYLDSYMQNEDVLQVSIYDKKNNNTFLKIEKQTPNCESGQAVPLQQNLLYENEDLGIIQTTVTTCHFEKNLENNILIFLSTLIAQLTISLGLLVWLLNTRVIRPARILISQVKMADMNQMFMNIAHQWRQPLTELSNYILNLEMSLKLKKQLDVESTQSIITRSNRVIKHLSETINTFLNLSRTTSESNLFEIKQAIEETLLLLHQSLHTAGIRMILETNQEISLTGEKHYIIQTLFSLINNSIEAHRTHQSVQPEIRIQAFIKQNRCVITVEDNAGGITIQPIGKIFEPHYSHGKKSGSGLGLYLSRAMIEKIGGSLRAQNIKNGARFEISIPLKTQLDIVSRR